jgi:hypothetical protein
MSGTLINSLSIVKTAFLQATSQVGPVVALIVAIAIAGIAIIIVALKRN